MEDSDLMNTSGDSVTNGWRRLGGRDGTTANRTLPASFGQEGIALQHELAGGSPIFNVPAALELTGVLDRDALRQSLGEIVRRHDVLRTTFEWSDGALSRVVHPPRPVDLPVCDLRDHPAEERQAIARDLLDAEAAAPFDLQTEPGFRCMLIVQDDDRHVFFWNLHHIVCDGWSKSVFANELSECYAAFAAGRASELHGLVVGYGDFVERQRQVPPDVLAKQLEYWDEHLAGVEDLTGFPTDKPRTAARAPRGKDVEFTLPGAVRQGLSSLARRNSATLFMVLHAVWAALLHRAGEQPQVVVSVPFASRPSADFEPLIGFFVNVLAIKVDLRGDPGFTELLARVRDTALEAYEHQDVPFQRVAEKVLSRQGGRTGSLQQASLAFANLPYQDVRLEGLSVDRFALTRVDIRYELELHMWEDGDDGGLGGRLIYRPDLFDADTVVGLVRDLRTILDAVLVDPETKISDLPVASSPGRNDEWAWEDDSDDVHAVEPRTPTEAAVYAIWVDLLHYEDIGVEDNFLHIGGNSFLLAVMVSKIRSELGAELPVALIMRNPTVEGIAEAVDSSIRQDGG